MKALWGTAAACAAVLVGSTLLLAGPACADSLPGEALTVGPVNSGASRIELTTGQFDVIVNAAPLEVEARLIPHSIRWARVYESLLAPRALLEVTLPRNAGAITARYKDATHVFQMDGGLARARLYVALLDTAPVELFDGGKAVGSLRVRAKPVPPGAERLQVDWSCSPYGLSVTGLQDQFVSVGCRFTKTYYAAGERPQLEVFWTASNFTLRDGSSPPSIAQMSGSGPIRATLRNDEGEEREIAIEASVPAVLPRLKLAYGFGPYFFDAGKDAGKMDSRLSPSLMLYGNLGINAKESIRMFEALVFNGSVFSNFGAYYAYVAGNKFDGRITLVTLLGAQELSFKYKDSSEWSHDIFYPQGFEIVYSHAFGMENYHMIYGMFLSPLSNMDYKNIWLRFGRKYFWEINYIEWGFKGQRARMWGLSLGVPLARFF